MKGIMELGDLIKSVVYKKCDSGVKYWGYDSRRKILFVYNTSDVEDVVRFVKECEQQYYVGWK